MEQLFHFLADLLESRVQHEDIVVVIFEEDGFPVRAGLAGNGLLWLILENLNGAIHLVTFLREQLVRNLQEAIALNLGLLNVTVHLIWVDVEVGARVDRQDARHADLHASNFGRISLIQQQSLVDELRLGTVLNLLLIKVKPRIHSILELVHHFLEESATDSLLDRAELLV